MRGKKQHQGEQPLLACAIPTAHIQCLILTNRDVHMHACTYIQITLNETIKCCKHTSNCSPKHNCVTRVLCASGPAVTSLTGYQSPSNLGFWTIIEEQRTNTIMQKTGITATVHKPMNRTQKYSSLDKYPWILFYNI